jgi:hypothetical protein
MESWLDRVDGSDEGQTPSDRIFVQGKPVVRRGRKARDLPRKTARPPGSDRHRSDSKESTVKAILARFTSVVALLAALALTIGAGVRWA